MRRMPVEQELAGYAVYGLVVALLVGAAVQAFTWDRLWAVAGSWGAWGILQALWFRLWPREDRLDEAAAMLWARVEHLLRSKGAFRRTADDSEVTESLRQPLEATVREALRQLRQAGTLR